MTDTAPPISLDETGLAAWNTLAPELRRAGLLLASEEFALARLCDYISRWMRLRERVNAAGETYETVSKHGQLLRQNPDFKTMLDIEGEITALEDRFALTPVMRYKLKAIRAGVDVEPARPTLLAPLAAAATPDENSSAGAPLSPFGALRVERPN